MTWTGTAFALTCGEYSIETLYAPHVAYHLPKHQGRILGYPRTLDDAKALCERHQQQNQPRRQAA